MKKKELETAIEKNLPLKISFSDCIVSDSEILVNCNDCNAVIPYSEITSTTDLISGPLYVRVIRRIEADNLYILSQKAYVNTEDLSVFDKNPSEITPTAELKIGMIYSATVVSSCKWGAFCGITNFPTVLVHCTEWSVCRFHDMRNVARPGMEINVKIISKFVAEDGTIHYNASRKKAEEYDRVFSVGSIIPVTICNGLPDNSGIFCEVSPNKGGIIDVPPDSYSEGDVILGYIKKVTPKGYKLRPSLYRW